MFSESHCHLRDMSDKTVEQAKRAGVELILNAGIDLASSEQLALAAMKHRVVKACVGVHPWNADQYDRSVERRLEELAAYTGVVAISEIGLDYVGRRTREGVHVNEYVDKSIQRTAFHDQLRLAKKLRLPVIVHDRTPSQEVLDILEEIGNADTGAAIHGFSKDLAYARRCVEMRVYISIGLRGISASESDVLKEVIKETPLERLLTETDSANPEGVLTVAEKIAEIKGLRREDVGKTTTYNLRKLTKLLQ